MLINGKRALAYVQTVHDIVPIEGADNIELVHVLGWTLIAKKGEFTEGSKCVYIEIDAQVPETEVFEFLRPKHFKVKTYKLGKFKVVSQGLALPLECFPELGNLAVETDVTEKLGITYAIVEDNVRKGSDKDLILTSLKSRKPKLFKNRFIRWLMKHTWGRKIVIFLFGRKKDTPYKFPTHLTSKTDEERVENLPNLLGTGPWVATEKIDGASATFALEKKTFGKFEFYVCSRNVRLREPEQKCFYDENYYWEMAEKYDIREQMKRMFESLGCEKSLVIQGEVFGKGVQAKTYGMKDRDLRIFNVKIDGVRINSITASDTISHFGLKFVPILGTVELLPTTMEEVKQKAEGQSLVGEGIREGIVYRSPDGQQSFKNVSVSYLLEKHI